MKKHLIIFGSIVIITLVCFSPQRGLTDEISQNGENDSMFCDSSASYGQSENLNILKSDLTSGKPTLAYFYYSVACSCTAARCAIAKTAIDSIPELSRKNDSLNFIEIDAYLVPESESLYNITIVPAIVYYDKDGIEINRLEWGTNREAIWKLITHPGVKQEPLD